MKPRPGFYALLLLATLLSLAAAVVGLAMLHDTWWAIVLAPVLAVISTQTGFFGHDATHRQITRRERGSRHLGLFSANLMNGLSYGWWLDKHNAHHAHPNDLEHDPDVRAGALVFDKSQASGRQGIPGWTTRHQGWLFVPMLTLEALSLHAASIAAVLHPGLRHRKTEASLLTMHFTGYVSLLALTLTWQQALVFFVVHQGLFGVYLELPSRRVTRGCPCSLPTKPPIPFFGRC